MDCQLTPSSSLFGHWEFILLANCKSMQAEKRNTSQKALTPVSLRAPALMAFPPVIYIGGKRAA